MHRRNAAEATGLVVLEGLHHLVTRVHDERPGPRDRLTDRPAAQDEHVKVRATAVLDLRRGNPECVSRTEDRQLTGLHGGAGGSDRAVTGENVRQRVVVGPPWDGELRAGAERGVDE